MDLSTPEERSARERKKLTVLGVRAGALFLLTFLMTLISKLTLDIPGMHFLSLSTCFIYICAYLLPTALGIGVYVAAFVLAAVVAGSEQLLMMLVLNTLCAVVCAFLMMLYTPGKPYRMALAVLVGTILYAGGWFLYNMLTGDTLNTLMMLMLDMVEWFVNAGVALVLLESLRFVPAKVRMYLDAYGPHEQL